MTQQFAYRYEGYATEIIHLKARALGLGIDAIHTDKYNVNICCLRFPVVRTTATGFIVDVDGSDKFVCNAWRKKYACLTVEEAWSCFIARRQAQARILRSQLHNVNDTLNWLASGNTHKNIKLTTEYYPW